MAKKSKVEKISEAKAWGPEPKVDGSRISIIRALNWYSALKDPEDSLKYVLNYTKNHDKVLFTKVQQLTDKDIRNFGATTGWLCRILDLGGVLDSKTELDFKQSLKRLGTFERRVEDEVTTETVKKDVNLLAERISEKKSMLIGEVEEFVDEFIRDGKSSLNIHNWLREKNLGPIFLEAIRKKYVPLYEQLFTAVNGRDKEFRQEYYAHYNDKQLKAYFEFIKGIVDACEVQREVQKTQRKPRKKKAKAPHQIVAKMKFMKEFETYKSIEPERIIKADQLWVYNTKTRMLAVYHSAGPSGLSVKGSTLLGFDPKTSVMKKLRKPEVTLKALLSAGKVQLRRLMLDVKTAEKPANGRMNDQTLLMRVM